MHCGAVMIRPCLSVLCITIAVPRPRRIRINANAGRIRLDVGSAFQTVQSAKLVRIDQPGAIWNGDQQNWLAKVPSNPYTIIDRPAGW